MTQETPDKAKGCFSRLALFFGLFWLVAVGVVLFTQTTGAGFEFTGSLLPIIFIFGILGVIRRQSSRTGSRGSSTRPRPTPQAPPPTPPRIPGRVPPVASPPAQPPPVVTPPAPPRPEPSPPIMPSPSPSTSPVPSEDVTEQPARAAREQIEASKLETTKPLSSEERLKAAREKYLKKP